MLQVKEGLPLVRFGTLIETPLNCLIVLKDGPIKTLADLKGKKVGYSVASFQDAYLVAILEVGRPDRRPTSTLVNVNFNLVTALLVRPGRRGHRRLPQCRADPARAARASPASPSIPEEHGVPVYDELIYVDQRRQLRDDPRLPRFLAAVEEATIFLTNHPEEALAMFMKSHTDLDDELNRRSFALTLPRFAKRPAALDAGRYERFAAFLKEKGLIDTVPPLDSYAIAPKW